MRERTGRQVTIKDLSRVLGLSITTISRALNGYSDVGEATRRRVIEAARTSGYQPNRNAQRLVTRRTRSFGWIREDGARIFVDPHFSEVFAGVLRASQQRNYDVVFAAESADAQTEVYNRYIREQSVDGFIVDLPRPQDRRIRFLLDAGVPFVVHGRTEDPNSYGWVDIDNKGIFRALAGVMLDSGHRHIAFVNGDTDFSYASDRRIGVEAALRDRDLSPGCITMLNSVHPMGLAGFQLTEQALADGKVTAILYSSSVMAVEGHAAIMRAGRLAGRDIEIATMDDELHHTDLSPYLEDFSFARSSLRAAGFALVEELVRQIEKGGEPQGSEVRISMQMRKGLNLSCLPEQWLGQEPEVGITNPG
jgi:LacI family transcriptional regulator, galactose operon repressor